MSQQIVAMSCWSKGGKGEYPVRFVVIDRGTKAPHRYTRCMQVNDGEHKDYFIYAHHHHLLPDALADAQEAVRENQKDFSPSNISHIPAWPTGESIRIVK